MGLIGVGIIDPVSRILEFGVRSILIGDENVFLYTSPSLVATKIFLATTLLIFEISK